MQVSCCRFQNPLYTGTWHGGSSLLSPHHQLSIQALPTRAHAQPNPFRGQIKVVLNNLLGSETCCPFISSSEDFWQNDLRSRSFWNPMRNSTQKGPLGKSHMNFSDATSEPRRKNGKLAIRFYSLAAMEVPIAGWFQKLLNRKLYTYIIKLQYIRICLRTCTYTYTRTIHIHIYLYLYIHIYTYTVHSLDTVHESTNRVYPPWV